jgi:hypothetical protein
MKVENMRSPSGNEVPNQFILTRNCPIGSLIQQEIVFQSYDKTIVKKEIFSFKVDVLLDEKYWDYSQTTGKYRNIFLGETKKETEKKIKSGEYILTNLN